MSDSAEIQIGSPDIKRRKQREYLWNVFCKAYSKLDLKEKAYFDIAELLEKPVESVKDKINGLRIQLGREINKENKTKSGQGPDEQYHSSWPCHGQLQFLQPVTTVTKSKDNLTTKLYFDVLSGSV